MDHLRSRVRDQPGQHGETLSLLKKKLRKYKISQAWWQAPVIPAPLKGEAGESLEPRKEAEVAVRQDWAITLQPGQKE